MPSLQMDLITRSDLILNGLMANSIFSASLGAWGCVDTLKI
jgi:hypothetical protein